MTPRILILGANGSVGRAIHRVALADQDVMAVAGLRRTLPGFAGAFRLVDATDSAQLEAAFTGMTHVINAAGGPPDVLRRGAAAVCTAARRMAGLHVVHLSSMAVYGDKEGLVSEDTPLQAGGAYGVAKIAAEGEAQAYRADGHTATILRPGIVHGPHSQQWTQRLGRLLAARRLGDLGPAGDGFCNLIAEEDLAAACLAACKGGVAGVFNVGIATPPTWNEYLTDLALKLGRVPVRRIGPARLALESRVLAPVFVVGARVLGPGRTPDAIPPSLLRLFGQRIRLDVSRAAALLNSHLRPRSQPSIKPD